MRILLVDALGSFTKDLATHWRTQGHDVLQRQKFSGFDVFNTDFVFIEWAAENALLASAVRLPVPVVVRLHSYEQFTDFPQKINWKNIDRLIYGSQHVADFVNSAFLPACPTVVIPSALDLTKWDFKKRQNVARPNVSVVGELDGKKGVQLLLQVMSQWTQATFHLRGDFYDGRYFTLVNDYVQKTGIGDRVLLYDRIPDINKFLDPMDYHLSCSPYEGHPYNIMEAMAKGIKPLIFNFSGAETLFPKELLWLTLKDLKERISDTYNSDRYRDWLLQHGWTLSAQMKQFDEVLENPKGVTIDDVRRYYDNYVPVFEQDLAGQNKRLQAIFGHIKQHITKDDRVVDLGCGIGITTNEIAKYAGGVTGIELSPKLVAAAEHHFPSIEFKTSDITDDEFYGVNTACLFDCLEHIIPERRKLLYGKLKQFDKILMTIPFGQNASGKRLQIIDEEVPVDEIEKALDTHKLSKSQTYDLAEWGQYRFLLFEKAKKEVPKERELALAD